MRRETLKTLCAAVGTDRALDLADALASFDEETQDAAALEVIAKAPAAPSTSAPAAPVAFSAPAAPSTSAPAAPVASSSPAATSTKPPAPSGRDARIGACRREKRIV